MSNIKKLMKKEALFIVNKIYDDLKEVETLRNIFGQSFKIVGETQTPGRRIPGNLILYGSLK